MHIFVSDPMLQAALIMLLYSTEQKFHISLVNTKVFNPRDVPRHQTKTAPFIMKFTVLYSTLAHLNQHEQREPFLAFKTHNRLIASCRYLTVYLQLLNWTGSLINFEGLAVMRTSPSETGEEIEMTAWWDGRVGSFNSRMPHGEALRGVP